jgi:membrane-associated protease RseP (regulator of RpoE activity)
MRRAHFRDKVAERGSIATIYFSTAIRGRDDMEANIGRTDRIIRIVAGLLLLSLAFVGPQTPWGFIGLIPLATAFINFCPAYKLLGINTLGK